MENCNCTYNKLIQFINEKACIHNKNCPAYVKQEAKSTPLREKL